MATPPDQRRAPSRPPQTLPPGPSRKPAEPVLQQRALAALLLALISLVGLLMVSDNIRRGAVVLVVVLAIGGAGLWLSTTAMSRARRAGTARPRLALTATVLAAAGTGLSALTLLAFAIFWPQIVQYSDCMAGANTVIAQNACNKQLSNTLRDDVGLVGG